MDLPGTSNDLVLPLSAYYSAPTSPPMTSPPISLLPTLTALYPHLLQLPNFKTSDHLIKSDMSAFKEVNDLRTTVNMILPMLPLYPPLTNQLGSGFATQPVTLQTVLQQSLLRNKRPAAQTPTVPQPECPVSMRTVLNNPSFLLNQWMFSPSMKVASPTLPTGNLPAAVGETQVASVEDPQVKWSSPSSVDSNGQKTDSSAASAGETQNIDIIGDGSESPTSSTHSTQEISMIHPTLANVLKESNFLFNTSPLNESAPIRIIPPSNGVNGKAGVGGPDRKPRKPVNDDIVKIVRNQDLSEKNIATFEIPVPKAIESDPAFRPVSEAQIIQQIIQGKKYEEMEVGECMIQLCKKLAEKRVFGPRLMSQTTVAGLNHSNYSNLPIKGICYIQHVCRKVLRDKFEHEEDFWDKFREAMRKLAARCRRVRHAKKTKHNREEAQAEMLSKRYGEDIFIGQNGLIRPKLEPSESVTPTSDVNSLNLGQLSTLITQLQRFQRKSPIDIEAGMQPHEMNTLTNFMNFLSRQNKSASPPPSQ
ncbi:unnamed protein product [Caenorhabditis sp. 36 PRJEB53466]|nr:unnamed protein product [Caenorhabditis sp. 36 PRJEB53466]